MDDKEKTDREFWVAWLALCKTLTELRAAVMVAQGAETSFFEGVGVGEARGSVGH